MNSYEKINYVNGSEPSISAENLNHMDDGIEAATAAITKIETDIATKANTTEVNAALSKKTDKTSVDSALALKQDKSNMFSTKQNLTDKESSYPSVKYLENYYYDMDDVDDALALKADKESINALKSDINNIEDAIFVKETSSVSLLNDDIMIFSSTGKNKFNIADEAYIQINSSGAKRYGVSIDGLNGTYCFSFIEVNVRTESNELLGYKKIYSDGSYSSFEEATNGIVINIIDGETLIIYDNVDQLKMSKAYGNMQLELGTTPTQYEPYSGGEVIDPTPTPSREKRLKIPFLDVASVDHMVDTKLFYRMDGKIYYHNGNEWVDMPSNDSGSDDGINEKNTLETSIVYGTGKIDVPDSLYSKIDNMILYAGDNNQSSISFHIVGDNLFDFSLAKDKTNWLDRTKDLGRYIFPIKIDKTKKYSFTIPNIFFMSMNIGLRSKITDSEISWIKYGNQRIIEHCEINGSVYTDGYIYLTCTSGNLDDNLKWFETAKLQEGKYKSPFTVGVNREITFDFSNPLRKVEVETGETYVDDNHVCWVSDSADFKRGIIIRRVSDNGDIISPTIEQMSDELLNTFSSLFMGEKTTTILNNVNSHMELSYEISQKYFTLNKMQMMINEDFSAFAKFGVIGDSLSVGNETDPATNAVNKRNIYYSWGQQMARKIGNVCLNFGFTGATTKTWWDGGNGDGTMRYPKVDFDNVDNRCQAYIVGIGTNDTSEIGTIDDVNFSDYSLNADSFYGNFAKILQHINITYPEAKVFVFTIPFTRENHNKNHAIKEITERTELNNVYLIDIAKDWKNYFLGEYSHEYNYHYGAAGYADLARINYMAISDYMHRNPTEFIGISFIPYGQNNEIE